MPWSHPIHRPSTLSQIVPLRHWKTGGTLNASRIKEIPLFYSEIGFTFGWVFIHVRKLFIRRVRKRKITRTVLFVKQNNSSLSMISSIRHKQSISWTFFNDAMAISAKEMPKNHTDKERFAAASSCIQTGILTLLFPRKRRRSSPSPFISHRVLEAVASRILKSLIEFCQLGSDLHTPLRRQ